MSGKKIYKEMDGSKNANRRRAGEARPEGRKGVSKNNGKMPEGRAEIAGIRKLEGRKLESRDLESRRSENRKSENRDLESRKPESRKLEKRKPESGKRESRRLENRKQESKKQESSHAVRHKKRVGSAQTGLCPVFGRCGGCQYLDLPYEEQLKLKYAQMQSLLGRFCKVRPMIGMEPPFHYRNKVHAVFGYHKGEAVSGVYREGTHELLPVESCMIEDQKADEIIGTIRGMLKSFKIRTYNEDTGYGLLRHVLVRCGFATGQIMVVLVTASPIFPSKNNFVKALREVHPEITTIVQNINGRDTSMVLGNQEHVLYGKGYIEDVLCGCRFRISSQSFYQVNPVQTEKLYAKAIELAGLTGKETVLDAYCGIGTIGLIAAKHAEKVIGVELNEDAVRDAVWNAKYNNIKNIRFYCNDASKFMMEMAADGAVVDVVLMDPPRSGSTEEFIRAVKTVKAKQVVYVSCGLESLARDLEIFGKMGYEAKEAWGVDLFPETGHVETVVLLSRKAR